MSARGSDAIGMAPRLRINIIANFAGQLSSVALAIVFTPVYIHFLGIEAYGLIGFYITLRSSIAFLEMGLSRACNRELARLSGQGEEMHRPMLDTLRSLESVYWIAALLIGTVLSLASIWIATAWLHSSEFSGQELQHIVVIMAWVIALRWPTGIYSGALMGLQRQVLMNSIRIASSLLSWAGSAFVLWLISANVQTFFVWQLLVSLCSTVMFAVATWRVMPGTFSTGNFSIESVKRIAPFAAGVGGNAILGMLLSQADKLILSALIPLKQFGYYVLAAVIASSMAMLAGPVSNALFPRLSQYVGKKNSDSNISSLYHLACQAVAVLVIPSALLIAFFSRDVLFVYTGSHEIALMAAPILTILVIARMLHSSMIVPYALQMAYNWMKLSIYMNIVSVIWIVPAMYWLASTYGPIGAAIVWLILTIGYVIIGVPLMHRKLLIGEWDRWMWRALVFPMLSVSSVLMLMRHFVSSYFPSGRWDLGLTLVVMLVMAFVLAFLSTYDVYKWGIRQLARRGAV